MLVTNAELIEPFFFFHERIVTQFTRRGREMLQDTMSFVGAFY
jgi:hypothetical protein